MKSWTTVVTFDTGGVAHAGFGLWYGPEDKRKKRLPVLLTEKQTIDRAELYGVLTAVENKTPSTTTCWTDLETVYAGSGGSVRSGSDMGGWGHMGR